MKNPKSNLPLKYISQQTGLSPQLIRVWEKRYEAIKPKRLSNNRRVYTEEDLNRLLLFKHLIAQGHLIGQIAHLKTDELQALHTKASEKKSNSQVISRHIHHDDHLEKNKSFISIIRNCIRYAKNFDTENIHIELNKARFKHTPYEIIEYIITPLMYEIGNLWKCDEVTVAEEHLISNVIKTFIISLKNTIGLKQSNGTIVIACPEEQQHEIGSSILTILTENLGFKTIYLGINTPDEEIIRTANFNKASHVILSVTYSNSNSKVEKNIQNIRKKLNPNIKLIAGGLYFKMNKNIQLKDIQILTHVSELQNELVSYLDLKKQQESMQHENNV